MDFTLSSYIIKSKRIDFTKYSKVKYTCHEDYFFKSYLINNYNDFTISSKTRYLTFDGFSIRGSYQLHIKTFDYSFSSIFNSKGNIDYQLKSIVGYNTKKELSFKSLIIKNNWNDFKNKSAIALNNYVEKRLKSKVIIGSTLVKDFGLMSSVYKYAIRTYSQGVSANTYRAFLANGSASFIAGTSNNSFYKILTAKIEIGCSSIEDKFCILKYTSFDKVLPVTSFLREYTMVPTLEVYRYTHQICVGKKFFNYVIGINLPMAIGRQIQDLKTGIFEETDRFSLELNNSMRNTIYKLPTVKPLKKQPEYIANSRYSSIIGSDIEGLKLYTITGTSAGVRYDKNYNPFKISKSNIIFNILTSGYKLDSYLQKISKESFDFARIVKVREDFQIVTKDIATQFKQTFELPISIIDNMNFVNPLAKKIPLCFFTSNFSISGYTKITGINYNNNKKCSVGIDSEVELVKKNSSLYIKIKETKDKNIAKNTRFGTKNAYYSFLKLINSKNIIYSYKKDILSLKIKSMGVIGIHEELCKIGNSKSINVKPILSYLVTGKKKEDLESIITDMVTGIQQQGAKSFYIGICTGEIS